MATGSTAKRHRAHDAITIGDEMKRYEEEACSSIVDLQRPCVVRLDGHCFHTYTKGFRRPYDLRIHEAMVATATDLLERFGAVTAYTESDEISLLFPPSTAESPSLPFSGRVQKIVSVSAGFASARFNLHMASQPFDGEGEAPLAARVARSDAHFDSRVFSLPDEARLVEYMRWRALLDCRHSTTPPRRRRHLTPCSPRAGATPSRCSRRRTSRPRGCTSSTPRPRCACSRRRRASTGRASPPSSASARTSRRSSSPRRPSTRSRAPR
mmetsp:Transcript_32543/g.102518  ORF Transcript_32543/g.102518 Transcript_32543/m.102518 type:complete len:268 (+) Transcript_32543:130-933(+)